MLGLLVWNALYILRTSNETELIKRAQTTTNLFAASNKDAVLSTDLATLESFVNEVLKHPGIIYARVIDGSDNVLAQSGDKDALDRKFQADTNYIDINDGIYDSCALIEVAGITYGRVEIGFSITDTDEIIAGAKNKSIAFAGIEMILTAIFSLILGVYLTRSINDLRSGSQNIAAGKLGYQIKVKGNDEISAAADAFNEMSIKLQQLENDHSRHCTELAKSELTYRKTFETTPIGMFHSTPGGKLIQANTSLAKILGYNSPEELISHVNTTSIAEALYVDPSKRSLILDEILDNDDWPTYENEYRCRNGKIITANLRIHSVYNGDGSVQYLEGFIEDITEHKKADQMIRASLKEKDLLLKEVHHRVKNNMQIISSLLNLQSKHAEDKQYNEMFTESKNRIRTMSLVHEHLYQSKDLANIDFHKYINSLGRNLFISYDINANDIQLEIDAKDMTLGIDLAIPCGLIINELLSNSLKHAFPDGRKGRLFISLKHIASGTKDKTKYELIVRDNGIGIPETKNIRELHSLGLQLVVNLTEHQLQGSLDMHRNDGTLFTIIFTEMIYKNRL